MKRMHVHVAVNDLQQSINFYSALFAAQPTVRKPDYAKWMLDDPRVNFAISARGRPDRTELRERCLEWPQHLAFQVKYCKLAEPIFGIGADDPIRSGTGIRRCTEFPQRHAKLSGHWRKRFRCPQGKIEAVEIPPTAAIGHEEDCPTVGRPFGLED
jgi:hypothetical protein